MDGRDHGPATGAGPRRPALPPQRGTTLSALSVTIGPYTFTNGAYDALGDVLYLDLGNPADAVVGSETPEGHLIRYDPNGRVVGITLISVRWILEHDGEVAVTLPPARVEVEGLEPALLEA